MKTHIKKQKTIFGQISYFKPGKSGTYSPGLSIIRLKKNGITFESNKTEIFILLLEGNIKINLNDDKTNKYIFSRKNVFDEEASGLYVPPETKISIQSLSDFSEAAICYSSELQRGVNEALNLQPRAFYKNDLQIKNVGKDTYERKVITICGQNKETKTIIIGETFSKGGNWSSYPPHKHEKNNPPYESKFKEIYYYRIKPDTGFAFQGLYSDISGNETAFLVRDGDAVFISNGYHPVSSAPGYDLYYLWILCGQNTELMWNVDKNHKWLNDK